MKTASSILLLICFGLSLSLQGQVNRYAFGDSIFVWATSLNMRESPDPDATVVEKVTYGSAVVIVDDSIGKVAHKYKAIESKSLENGDRSKPYYINGFWVKVNFDGTVGYVFDGYLSKIKPLPNIKGEIDEDIIHWATKIYRMKLLKQSENDGEIEKEYSDASKSIILNIGGGGICGFISINIKAIQFGEAVMLGLQIFGGKHLVNMSKDNIEFAVNYQYCMLHIYKLNNGYVLISLSCCC